MRVAICGCAGIGKTALAAALSSRLDAQLIDENYAPLFIAGGLSGAPEALADRFEQVLRRKQPADRSTVVADRCGADLFNLWLAHQLHRLADRTAAFAAACHEQTRRFDLLVFPPWDELKLVPHDAADSRVRVQNRWIQLRNHAAILGLATLWRGPDRVLELPRGLGTPAQRARWLERELQRRGLLPETAP
ncbi:MAG: AAA family ATPase [Pseudomonadota bacterium]|nr:AAA family ATPase [Pseudomonadota bacterium]